MLFLASAGPFVIKVTGLEKFLDITQGMTMNEIEIARQLTIEEYQLDQRCPEPQFDAVIAMASELFKVPIAAVTVLQRDKQVFPSSCGIEGVETARADAFCNVTVEGKEVFVVEDALEDPRFRDNPMVTGEPYIRFYAGAPIRIGKNIPIGALCLIDRKPRQFSSIDRDQLTHMAGITAGIIELRIGSRRSEQRQYEIQLQSELLRATIDNVRQGFALIDTQGQIILNNAQLFDLLHLEGNFITHQNVTVNALLSNAVSAGSFGPIDTVHFVRDFLSYSSDFNHKSVELQDFEGRFLELRYAAIEGGRSILTIEDVSERHQLVMMKDEFISTASHELRTPLTSIRGALAILSRRSEESMDEQGRQMLNMATRNAERLTDLVNDILDIEKLGSPDVSMRAEQVDLGQLLNDSCDQLRPYAVSHEVTISLSRHHTLIVRGDVGRLQQAVTNLLSNACKFSPRGSEVKVTGELRDGQIHIVVEDVGPGIPEQFREQIFRRFAQADAQHRSGVAGTGLGLAITKAIVEQHGGEIGYDSTLGVGTRFWVSLPEFLPNRLDF